MKLVTTKVALEFEKGKIYRLGYNHYNKGIFFWEHDKVDEHRGETMFSEFRLVGRFSYDSPQTLSDKGDYLYEFEGAICRGSGAEPCWLLEESETEDDIKNINGE